MRFILQIFLFGCLFAMAPTAFAAPIVAGSFSTTWNTGDSSMIQINLGSCPSAVYWESFNGGENSDGVNFTCDGSFDTVVTFDFAGEHRVDFSGNFTEIDLGDQNNRDKFRSVEQWGDSSWESFFQTFMGVTELSINAVDAPDLTNAGNLYQTFDGATNFNSDISNWDVSNINNFYALFRNTAFNQPLNDWDVTSVQTMGQMFSGATNFNQPLDSWDVSNVYDMSGMFAGATDFNQPLNSWVVSDVISMDEMFAGATSFNQPLDNWNLGEQCPSLAFNWWHLFVKTAYACVGSGATFNMEDIFAGSGLDTENYTTTLRGWSEFVVIPQDVNLGTVPATYCDTAQAARDVLTDGNGWIISDLGPEVCAVAEVEVERSSGSEGTKVGVRTERLEALRDAVTATTSPTTMTATVSTFVSAVRNLLTYLTENEEEIASLSPEESKQLIITLRDAIFLVLKLLPGV
ncbi:MAG: BspA family leucine-rich repeat surface protein [Candidatus Pacebacteria bacterium]|jgi:surface protein|nr:BspA family leucine-rich repeat surface protein [Candidatus Paceibacterota bacterium]